MSQRQVGTTQEQSFAASQGVLGCISESIPYPLMDRMVVVGGVANRQLYIGISRQGEGFTIEYFVLLSPAARVGSAFHA